MLPDAGAEHIDRDNRCDDDNDDFCDSAMPKAGGVSVTICNQTTLTATVGDDCNDTVATGFPINPGATEICDGIDNNCAGGIDEGLTRTQTCGVGACLRTASQTCAAGAWGPACVAGAGSPEICDGIDNNCDTPTQVDEGNPGGGGACITSCGSGVFQCVNGAPVCQGPGGFPEICDGKDNNCDGETDEGCDNPRLGGICPICRADPASCP